LGKIVSNDNREFGREFHLEILLLRLPHQCCVFNILRRASHYADINLSYIQRVQDFPQIREALHE
tara:strand:- start:238 stop:432 length:195 start_codon:yes stop_codon:yes gene_type:complete